ASVSTGSSRRAARSFKRRRCTPAAAATPPRRSSDCSTGWCERPAERLLHQHTCEIRVLEGSAIGELLLIRRAAVAALRILVVEVLVAELLHSCSSLARVARMHAVVLRG